MNVGGQLDLAALARLFFTTMTRQQQAQAMRKMAAAGWSEFTISHATALSIEQVRRVLGERDVDDCD